MHFFCNMNVIVCTFLLSVSINTVTAIYRIPIKPFFRAHSDEIDDDESDELGIETDTDNPQIERELNPIDINDTKNDDNTSTGINTELRFTDFVLEAAKVLKTYENNVLEQAFTIINGELWKDVYKGCKAHELADIRKYVSDKLGLLKNAPAETLRQHLDYVIDALTNEDYGESEDLVDYINSLYFGETDKFIEVLLAMVHRRISDDVDLADVLKGALKYFLFDHYCNLDDIVRHELMKMIKHYWRQFISKVVYDKNGSNKEALPFVTPFIYEKDNEKFHKKRRFNKVNAGRPLTLRFIDINEPGENVRYGENEHNMRANSIEKSYESSNSVESNGDKDAKQDKRIYVRTNDSTEEHKVSKGFKTSITDKKIKRFRGGHSTVVVDNKITRLPLKSKSPVIMRQSNNSNAIERLINIGNLAKEINDMIGPEGKDLRNGQYVMNWDSLFNVDVLGLVMGDEPTTPEATKNVQGGNNQGVIITMKANYQE